MNDSFNIIGTWKLAMAQELDGVGFIHFSDAGRAYQFVPALPTNPEKRMIMNPWYSLEAPNHIRFRRNQQDEGWISDCVIEENTLVISFGEHRWVCTRAQSDEIPNWFLDRLASELSKP